MLGDLIGAFGGRGGDEDSFTGGSPEAFASTLVRKYWKYKALDEMSNKALDMVYTSPKEKMDSEQEKLDILLKRKQLGMPISDKDYEQATNNGQSFISHSLPLFGRKTAQAIPDPSFMKGNHQPFRGIGAGDTIKEIFSTTRTIDKGADNAHYLGDVLRLLGRRK